MMWPHRRSTQHIPTDRSGKINPTTGAIVFLLAAILVIGVLLLIEEGGFNSEEPLPADAYRENPANFLGNRYELTGQVHSLLLWEQGLGRLVAVTPDAGSGRIAVYVPDSLGVSLHTGQRYEWELSVRDGGLLYVEDLEKY